MLQTDAELQMQVTAASLLLESLFQLHVYLTAKIGKEFFLFEGETVLLRMTEVKVMQPDH